MFNLNIILFYILFILITIFVWAHKNDDDDDDDYNDDKNDFIKNFIFEKDNIEEESYEDEFSYKNYTFLASIQFKVSSKLSHICSGTVLSESWILTAAHCVCYPYTNRTIPAEKLYVITGVESLEGMEFPNISYTVPTFIIEIHPEYNFHKYIHDIALINLGKKLDMSKIVPISLKKYSVWNSLDQNDQSYGSNEINVQLDNCVALGWSNNFIHGAAIRLENNAVCLEYGENIKENEICTFFDENDSLFDDICQEESGGPLICGEDQVGVATFRLGCGIENAPNIFTKIDPYLPWLEKITEIEFDFDNGEKRSPRLVSFKKGIFRPGGWNPGGLRPGGSGWRPGGRPSGIQKPYYSQHGYRPGGNYYRVGTLAGQSTYYRRLGGYGYYGVSYRRARSYPIGLWWGRPVLFYYRPWFYLDYFWLHWYFYHPIWFYHAAYGYGYRGHGSYREYEKKPPPSYILSYCDKPVNDSDLTTIASTVTKEDSDEVVWDSPEEEVHGSSGASTDCTTRESTTTEVITTVTTVTTTTASIKTTPIISSTTTYWTKNVWNGMDSTLVLVYYDKPPTDTGPSTQLLTSQICTGYVPEFYNEQAETAEEMCEMYKVFCPPVDDPENKSNQKSANVISIFIITILLTYFNQ